jgi:LysM repeat protein
MSPKKPKLAHIVLVVALAAAGVRLFSHTPGAVIPEESPQPFQVWQAEWNTDYVAANMAQVIEDESLQTAALFEVDVEASRQIASRAGFREEVIQTAMITEKAAEPKQDKPSVPPVPVQAPTQAKPKQQPATEISEPEAAEELPPVLEQGEPEPAEELPTVPETTEPPLLKVSYVTHTVARGDTFWGLSIKYGIPMSELLKVNNMTEKTALSVGMKLSVPVYQIRVKSTPGPQYGEFLDWWTEAQYVWPIGKDARIIDFETGKSFMARRTVGAFHADVEPLTASDSQIMFEIWGGWSWATRPVLVEVDGRRIAASSHAMPHSIQTITNNNFRGHFCIHFLNSTRHKDNLQQSDHQRNVRTAAGQ